MAYLEQANGIARSYGHVTLMFPFGLAPCLVFGDKLVPIAEPERFGAWGNGREQVEYVRAFALNETR